MQYAQAGSRGRDAVLIPRDWQQSAARVSTRSRASSAAVMAQQAQQQRPCPAPSAPPERSAGVRDAIPVGVINCALVASLCGPQMALLALRCRCSRGAARRARAAVLSQYAIATHSLWEGAHFYRIPPGSHAGVRCCSEYHSVVAATPRWQRPAQHPKIEPHQWPCHAGRRGPRLKQHREPHTFTSHVKVCTHRCASRRVHTAWVGPK